MTINIAPRDYVFTMASPLALIREPFGTYFLTYPKTYGIVLARYETRRNVTMSGIRPIDVEALKLKPTNTKTFDPYPSATIFCIGATCAAWLIIIAACLSSLHPNISVDFSSPSFILMVMSALGMGLTTYLIAPKKY